MMSDNRGGVESQGASALLQPPADIYIVAGNATWLAVMTLILFPVPVQKMKQRLIA